MVKPSMTDQERAIATATALVSKIGAPPQAHSIWVRTTKPDGQNDFEYTIMVSKHPKWTGTFLVPTEMNGFKVERTEWPAEML